MKVVIERSYNHEDGVPVETFDLAVEGDSADISEKVVHCYLKLREMLIAGLEKKEEGCR